MTYLLSYGVQNLFPTDSEEHNSCVYYTKCLPVGLGKQDGQTVTNVTANTIEEYTP